MRCPHCGATWERDPLYDMLAVPNPVAYWSLVRRLRDEGCGFIRCEAEA